MGQLEHRLRRTLGPLRFLGAMARVFPDDVRFKAKNSLESITRTADDACARKHFLYLYTEEAKRHLMAQPETHDYAAKFRALYRNAHAAPDDWLNRALYVDMKTYLVDDILTKVDRMSMAVSLEISPAAAWTTRWSSLSPRCRRVSSSRASRASTSSRKPRRASCHRRFSHAKNRGFACRSPNG